MNCEFFSSLLNRNKFDFSAKLFKDVSFVDYFNKFCFLPVFGQRIAYKLSKGAFTYDPPLPASSRNQPVAIDMVVDWLYKERWPRFLMSKIVDEYCLSNFLVNFPLWKQISENCEDLVKEMEDTELESLESRIDELQIYEVGRVSGMLRFRTFVSRSQEGQRLYMFWMDVQHLRRTYMQQSDDQDTRERKIEVLIKNIRHNYFKILSPFRLPEEFVYVKPDAVLHTYQDFDFIVNLQKMVLERLQTYWLPVFLANQCAKYKAEKLRKLKEEELKRRLQCEEEARMIEQLLRRSSLVQYSELSSMDFIPAQKFSYDEDEDNFLLHDTSQAEIEMSTDSNFVSPEDLIEKLVFDSKIETKKPKKKSAVTFKISDIKLPALPSSASLVLAEDSFRLSPSRSGVSSAGYFGDASAASSRHASSGNNPRPEDAATVVAEEIAARLRDERENKKQMSDIYPEFDVIFDDEIQRRSKSSCLFDAIEKKSSTELGLISNGVENELSVQFESLYCDDQKFDNVRISGSQSAVCKRSNIGLPSTKKSKSSVQLPPIKETNRKCSNESLNLDSSDLTPSSNSSLSFQSVESSLSNEEIKKSSISPVQSKDSLSSSSSGKENKKSYDRDNWRDVFSEVLISDELSSFVYRSYLGRDDQVECKYSAEETKILKRAIDDAFYKEFGLSSIQENSHVSNEENAAETKRKQHLVIALDFWREIELLRRTYFTFSSKILKIKFATLLRTYVKTEFTGPSGDSVALLLQQLNCLSFDSHHKFPHPLIALQNELQSLLESDWLKFASDDREDFRKSILPLNWKMYPQRNSFPNLLPELRATPIRQIHDADYSKIQKKPKDLPTLTIQTFIDFKGHSNLKYRTSRAVHLLLMSSNHAIESQHTNGYFENDFDCGVGAEEESEDEGETALPPAPIIVRAPELDPKVLASMSAKEYPIVGLNYERYKSIRVIQRHRMTPKPAYMRPIRKLGQTIMRPEERPKNLLEVLRDDVHLMFFKKYLRMHKSEAPVMFWKAVDLLKQTEDARSRQQKAQTILKKFFGKLSGGGVMLQCDAELIKEIATVETVTTSMLVHAQTEVCSSLEKNWSRRYFNTFPEPEQEVEVKLEIDPKTRLRMMSTKLKHIWQVFNDFIRRAANFIKSMRNPKLYRDFRIYLKLLVKDAKKTRRSLEAGDASSTAIFFTQTINKEDVSESYAFTYRKLYGRKITIDFLHNDLAFYFEVDRYVSLIENAERNITHGGAFHKQDNDAIKFKAKTIVDCFINSTVPPKLRINIDEIIATDIEDTFKSGIYERGLFHDAMLTIFPLLLHYWREFCKGEVHYVPKKIQREERRKSVKEQHQKIIRRQRRQMKKKLKMPVSQDSSLASIKTKTKKDKSTYVDNRKLPNYVNDLVTRKQPFEKVKGLIWSDPPTLHFSLEHGLKLILPPRRKFGQAKEGDADDEEMFLSVWTRGNKEVNVIREGSNPKLYTIDNRAKNIVVKCDFIES